MASVAPGGAVVERRGDAFDDDDAPRRLKDRLRRFSLTAVVSTAIVSIATVSIAIVSIATVSIAMVSRQT